MGTKVERFEWLGLVCILVLALGLRLIQLNSGLWYDEIVTLVNYVRLPTADLLTTYSSLNNHILFSLLAKVSVTCFGESPWALRLPAVLFGVGSVAATWWLGRQVVSRGESLLAAPSSLARPTTSGSHRTLAATRDSSWLHWSRRRFSSRG